MNEETERSATADLNAELLAMKIRYDLTMADLLLIVAQVQIEIVQSLRAQQRE